MLLMFIDLLHKLTYIIIERKKKQNGRREVIWKKLGTRWAIAFFFCGQGRGPGAGGGGCS